LAKNPKFSPVCFAIEKGLEKLKKWSKTIHESDTYLTCLVLHPAVKLEYSKAKGVEAYNTGCTLLKKIFDSYYKAPKKARPSIAQNKSEDATKVLQGYGSNFILSALSRSSSQQSVIHDPRKELNDYLNSPRDETVTNPVRWWGYHSQQYPTLSRIARDYLAIQGSSVASERAFSSAGITDDLRRNHMDNQAFGLIQVLKYAYKTNFLNTTEEVAGHDALDMIELK
ncbi:hypothetical protein M378DRAFT_89621, partial [Amanita muscaria Koide BX008]